MIAGVASGVAHYLGIDTTLVRVLWALTVFVGGFGIVAYLVLWIVLPEADTDHTVIGDMRARKTGSSTPPEASSSAEDDATEEDSGDTPASSV